MSKASTATKPPNVLRIRERPVYERLTQEFARMAKEYRERQGLSLEALSKKSGVAVSRIQKFEAAKAVPYIEDLFKLADAYRVCPSVIVEQLSSFMDDFDKKATAHKGAAS